MNSEPEKNLINPTIWLRLDPDKVKYRIKKIAEQLYYKKYSNPNIWQNIDPEKVQERIKKITLKLEEICSLEERNNKAHFHNHLDGQDDQAERQ